MYKLLTVSSIFVPWRVVYIFVLKSRVARAHTHVHKQNTHKEVLLGACRCILPQRIYTHTHHLEMLSIADWSGPLALRLTLFSSSDDCLDVGNVRRSSPALFGFFKHLWSVKLISAPKKGSLSGVEAADPHGGKDGLAKCTQAQPLCSLICIIERLY